MSFALRTISYLSLVLALLYLGYWQILVGIVIGWLLHSQYLMSVVLKMYGVDSIEDINPKE